MVSIRHCIQSFFIAGFLLSPGFTYPMLTSGNDTNQATTSVGNFIYENRFPIACGALVASSVYYGCKEYLWHQERQDMQVDIELLAEDLREEVVINKALNKNLEKLERKLERQNDKRQQAKDDLEFSLMEREVAVEKEHDLLNLKKERMERHQQTIEEKIQHLRDLIAASDEQRRSIEEKQEALNKQRGEVYKEKQALKARKEKIEALFKTSANEYYNATQRREIKK